MNKPTFSSLLSKPASDFERPKPAPQGTYLAAVHGLPRFDKSSKKQTEFAEFTVNLLEAGSDVDPEELATYGGVVGKQMKATFYLTEGAMFMLREFLAALGLDETQYESTGAMIDDTPGQQFLATVTHEVSQDGKSTFARITGWAPVDAE